MTRYVLWGRLGTDDRTPPDHDDGDVVQHLDLLADPRRLRFGLHEALGQLARLGLRPSEVGIDLMVLAVHVHAADTRLSRVKTAQDGWTRRISLMVPVSDPDHWNGARPVLRRMLRFLTGDLWDVGFRPRPPTWPALAPLGRRQADFDGVALFSGGLDSLVGALDVTADGSRPLFVSHAGEGAVSRPQRDVFQAMIDACRRTQPDLRAPDRIRLAMRLPKGLVPGVGSEDSTRGRSFVFIAAAAMAGAALGGSFPLRVPENGLIAINVPLDPTRLGSNSTRTTHPWYLHRWNELLRALGIPGDVRNPYALRTKGEMLAGCARLDLLGTLVTGSVSCAHPSARRFRPDGHAHCGLCVPCLIRRAAILHAWGQGGDATGYGCEDLSAAILDTTRAEGLQVRAFQYAIARVQERPEIARMLVHKPGPLGEDIQVLGDIVGVYRRGMSEVARLLEGVRTRPGTSLP